MTAPAGRLPTFFVVGAQKSGTSTLHRMLQLHPEAFLCDPKEPHYFSDAAAAAKGEGWYRSLFAGAGEANAVGEASTTYSMFPHYSGVVDRVVAAVAQPKLIYLVREPVARMRSAYLHALARGSETRPISQALREDPRYLQTSSYALQIEQWLHRVAREQILLLSLDELHAHPDRVLARTAGFLGIDPDWRPAVMVPPANVSEGKLAPRGWWRRVGEAALRSGRTDLVPGWAVRLNDSTSPAVRREIAAAELVIADPLAAELRRALAADRERLVGLWGPGPSPEWMHQQS